MNNRIVLFFTIAVLAGMGILLAINMSSILTGQPAHQTYLKYNNVRGMAVGHNQMLYTLNFKQQNDVIDILNRSVRVLGVKPGKRQKPNIEKIVVYQFDNQPDIVITPIAYVDGNLVYSVPQWDQDGYLMELSDGDMQKLLMQTYDP